MFEKALTGDRRYWGWIGFLLVLIAAGGWSYLLQLEIGLGITGLSRDVTWGFYIAQFTFLVGVAASAVMVVLPYYLHNFKAFGRITILGEYLAIAAVMMCMLFITVDLGQPGRMINMIRHPSPRSILFWDMIVLSGYLLINVVISRISLKAERDGTPPPKWIKPVILLSIPWAISIHTVTAFIYAGLAARPFWMTAILAPRFLASAFSSGPALLILFCLLLKRFTRFDAGWEAIQKLAEIVAYAVLVNIFFLSGSGGAQRAGALDVAVGRSRHRRRGDPDHPPDAPGADAPDARLYRRGRFGLDREGARHDRHRIRPLAARQGDELRADNPRAADHTRHLRGRCADGHHVLQGRAFPAGRAEDLTEEARWPSDATPF
jgi:formate-dependent nitrite reductase membrane component NrfD